MGGWGGVKGGGVVPCWQMPSPSPLLPGNCTPLHWAFFTSVNFKLKSQTSVVINWADFSVPNILSRQSNEDMKYEYKRRAISCDLVQVWASQKEEGLLQNMSEAVQEILRPAIDTNPHTTPLARSFVPVLIQIIPNTTTLSSWDVLWGALWPRFHGGPCSKTTWLFWHPPHFGYFFHPHFCSSSILTTILLIFSTYFCKTGDVVHFF